MRSAAVGKAPKNLHSQHAAPHNAQLRIIRFLRCTAKCRDRSRMAIIGMRTWPKRSTEGRDYLSVKLDDPSFNAPIYANLFDDEGAETYTLIWSRSRKPSGD